MELFGFWLLCGMVSAVIAVNKGNSGCGWFLLGLLLGPIGLVLSLVVQGKPRLVEEKRLRRGESRRCLACAELVRAEALKCRFCGSDLAPLRPPGAEALEPDPDDWGFARKRHVEKTVTRGSEMVVVHGCVIEIEREGRRDTAPAARDSTSSDTSSQVAPEAVAGDGVKPAPAKDKQTVRNSTQRRDSVSGGMLLMYALGAIGLLIAFSYLAEPERRRADETPNSAPSSSPTPDPAWNREFRSRFTDAGWQEFVTARTLNDAENNFSECVERARELSCNCQREAAAFVTRLSDVEGMSNYRAGILRDARNIVEAC